jgi:hypothetical protein
MRSLDEETPSPYWNILNTFWTHTLSIRLRLLQQQQQQRKPSPSHSSPKAQASVCRFRKLEFVQTRARR